MILALDIGGTLIKWGVFENFIALKTGDFTCPSKEGGKIILKRILDLVDKIRLEYALDGIAISAAGVIEPNDGYVRSA